jgi:hypothetical protein
MSAPILLACAAAVAPAAHAPAEGVDLQQYLQRAQARADILLQAHGIDPEAQSVAVRACVSANGRLTEMQLLRSSGLERVDRMVGHVLRKVLLADAPIGLVGGSVTLSLGSAPDRRARVPEAAGASRRAG